MTVYDMDDVHVLQVLDCTCSCGHVTRYDGHESAIVCYNSHAITYRLLAEFDGFLRFGSQISFSAFVRMRN